jgi:ribosome-associated protein
MDLEKLKTEVIYKAVRSSGAGGQNVNKVSTKVILTFDLNNTNALTPEETKLIETKLGNRISSAKMLSLHCEQDRSQLKNKKNVFLKFIQLITHALKLKTPRKPTKVSKAAIKKRLKEKQTIALTKKFRQKPSLE